jgi:hypothetical protein
MALAVEGVIYAIHAQRSKKVYVGQTVLSSFARFQQHVNGAYNKKSNSYTTPLAEFIRRQGHSKLLITPLEIIPKHFYAHRNREMRVKLFNAVASPRENFWIDRLRSYVPWGLNVKSSERARVRRGRRKPMIWRRKKMREQARLENQYPRNAPANASQRNEVRKRLFGSREYTRRVNHLVSHETRGTLNTVDLDQYKPIHLWRMYRQAKVMAAEEFVRNAPIHSVVTLLSVYLFSRTPVPTAEKSFEGSFIRIAWETKLWNQIPLRQILFSPEIKGLLPGGVPFPKQLVICKVLSSTIASKIFNFSNVARNVNPPPPFFDFQNENCVCRDIFDARYRTHESGCVYTGDTSIIALARLRHIVSLGSRFRTHMDSDLLKALEVGLDEFIAYHSREGMEARQFLPWKIEITEKVRKALQTAKEITDTVKWSGSCTRYLKFLQRYLVITPVDKANTNTAFICKNVYAHILNKELSAGGAYTPAPVGTTPVSIMASHTCFLKKHTLNMPDNLEAERCLGYLYFIPKLHKRSPAQRFICGMAECTTSKLSKTLSGIMDAVLRSLRAKDESILALTGVRRYFVVRSYEEVAAFLHKWPRTKNVGHHRLCTGDFSTMYTAIPHDDLYKRICDTVHEAWTWEMKQAGVDSEAKLYLHAHSTKSHVWAVGSARGNSGTVQKEKGVLVFSLESIRVLLRFMIENVYVVNGESVKRQTIGMPMGTNCAPNLANLYLYAYESSFVDRLLAKRGRVAAARFHMSFRLIDDTLSVDNPEWRKYAERKFESDPEDGIGGIYPAALILNDTTVIPDKEVTFLGIRIRDRRGRLCLSVFDKRSEFPFKVLRYPHMCSLIPQSIPYGVLTGQLYRAYRICSHAASFIKESRKVVSILLRQGCTLPRIASKIRNFLQSRRADSFRWRLMLKFGSNVTVTRIMQGFHTRDEF